MRHPRIIIASISLAAAAAIGGGITAAAATTSHASSPTRCQPARRGDRPHRAGDRRRQDRDHPGQQSGPAVVLLPERHGGEVVVTGGLAALWPPLTSASPAATGLTGKLTAVRDIHGDQVAYNGHLLYTFADDQAGQVTGQGVQGFFVATPGLTPIAGSSTAGSSTTAGTAPAPAASSGSGYGY